MVTKGWWVLLVLKTLNFDDVWWLLNQYTNCRLLGIYFFFSCSAPLRENCTYPPMFNPKHMQRRKLANWRVKWACLLGLKHFPRDVHRYMYFDCGKGDVKNVWSTVRWSGLTYPIFELFLYLFTNSPPNLNIQLRRVLRLESFASPSRCKRAINLDPGF